MGYLLQASHSLAAGVRHDGAMTRAPRDRVDEGVQDEQGPSGVPRWPFADETSRLLLGRPWNEADGLPLSSA